jgi:hypothetical protein
MEDPDGVAPLLARPPGALGAEHHGPLVMAKNILHLEAVRAPRQRGELAKDLEKLSRTFAVTGQKAPAGNMDTDVFGPILTLQ